MSKRIGGLAGSLAVILLAALALRAGYGWEYAHEHTHRALAVAPFLFEPANIAVSLVEGRGFGAPLREQTGPTAWLTPIYPLLLAAIFRLCGVYTFGAWLAAAGCNVAFSTLTAAPVYLVGRRIGGRAVGALAGWLWAVFPNAIKLPVESMWDASLTALLAAVIVWATLELDTSHGVWHWYAYGLLWGLALMTSPALLAVMPLFLAWLAWRWRRAQWALVAAGAAALCAAPWTLRNFRELHAFIPLRSVLGLTLWLGNHEQSAEAWPGRLHPLDNAGERARYVELGEVEYMRQKQCEALEFARQHPAEEARAAWSHFTAIWTGGSTHPLADWMRSDSWEFRCVLLWNLLAAAGALAGAAILVQGRSEYAFPLVIFPAMFPLVYYVTLGSARYRHPMDPVLLLLTAVALRRFRSGSKPLQPGTGA